MKLIAAIVVLVLLAIGFVGLLLPIIPGVLFLAVAAVIAARHFPAIADWVREHRTLGRHHRTLDRHLDRVACLWRAERLSRRSR